MITGIVFSNFASVTKPQSPIGVSTGYIESKPQPIVPVHIQKVNLNG